MKYLIASGWWSCEPELDNRNILLGDDEIRDVSFHSLWRDSIDRFTNGKDILVVDSNSPRKPSNLEGEIWINMQENFGHSTNHIGKYSGYTRSIFVSMMYAYTNDYDYWVFVEQDALLFGENIIEKVILDANKDVIYGSGSGTPQPIQQSFMVFKRESIPAFINNMDKIKYTDSEMSPEWKFLFSVNKLARFLPNAFLQFISLKGKNRYTRFIKGNILTFVRMFDDFDCTKIGYGRARPIDFTKENFYFQHGSKQELDEYLNKIDYHSS